MVDIPRNWRFLFCAFFVKMWRRLALALLIEPLLLTKKRLAAPLLVFIFGIIGLHDLSRLGAQTACTLDAQLWTYFAQSEKPEIITQKDRKTN
jgi:hypothetical protein